MKILRTTLDEGILNLTNMEESKEIRNLVEKNIISIYDYELDALNVDALAGGYIGNLMGCIKNNSSYPLFDSASNQIISDFEKNRCIDFGNINYEVLVHA